ncbi:MAG: hypothetical protein K2K84_03035, partial [Muribaculaceae bacterium]|nr:hypothetical protein [Muribaculaceae bacterium]
KNAGTALESAEMLGKRLKGLLGNRVFGPHEPGIARIKNMFIQRLMVKIEPTVSVKQIKEILVQEVTSLKTRPEYRSVEVYFDVDPI